MTGSSRAHLRVVEVSTAQRNGFDRAFSVREVADILGVSVDSVYRLLRDGRITFQRISPRRTVVRESALEAFLAEVTVTRSPRDLDVS